MSSNDRPQCTIETCKNYPHTQHLYICKTCDFSETETICENCAKFCHNEHHLIDIGFVLGYCYCGYGTDKCHCFLRNPVSGDNSVPIGVSRQCMKDRARTMYRCGTCNMSEQMICPSCRHFCHHDHETTSFNAVRNSLLFPAQCACPNCLIKPPENPPEPIPLCTYNITGKKYVKQPLYICYTCRQSGNTCVCINCAKVCHHGHQLVELSSSVKGFCNCGAQSEGVNCQCLLQEQLEPAQ